MVRLLLWLLALTAATTAPAAPAGPGAYKIGGVAVDVVAANPVAARAAAYRLAERRAWPQLWARITGNPATAAPRLADGAIEALVAGVEIEREQFSLTRYIGRLAIVFDRDRASGVLGGEGGQAPPMLLLPVQIDGAGIRTVYQTRTPWAAAWARFRDGASALDYVVPAASAGDNVVLTSFQARRHDRTLWRSVLARFKVADVLTAEVKLDRAWPGGPVAATAIARHGPDAVELGRLTLRTASPAGVEAMLDEAVRQVDAIYLRALQGGQLQVEKGLTFELAPVVGSAPLIGEAATVSMAGSDADVVTPDAKAWAATEAELKAVPGVTGVTLAHLVLGGTSHIVIRYDTSAAALAYALDQRGWRLAPAPTGVLLRRKVAGDPAVLPPPNAADLDKAEVIAEPDSDPLAPPRAVGPRRAPPPRPVDLTPPARATTN